MTNIEGASDVFGERQKEKREREEYDDVTSGEDEVKERARKFLKTLNDDATAECVRPLRDLITTITVVSEREALAQQLEVGAHEHARQYALQEAARGTTIEKMQELGYSNALYVPRIFCYLVMHDLDEFLKEKDSVLRKWADKVKESMVAPHVAHDEGKEKGKEEQFVIDLVARTKADIQRRFSEHLASGYDLSKYGDAMTLYTKRIRAVVGHLIKVEKTGKDKLLVELAINKLNAFKDSLTASSTFDAVRASIVMHCMEFPRCVHADYAWTYTPNASMSKLPSEALEKLRQLKSDMTRNSYSDAFSRDDQGPVMDVFEYCNIIHLTYEYMHMLTQKINKEHDELRTNLYARFPAAQIGAAAGIVATGAGTATALTATALSYKFGMAMLESARNETQRRITSICRTVGNLVSSAVFAHVIERNVGPIVLRENLQFAAFVFPAILNMGGVVIDTQLLKLRFHRTDAAHTAEANMFAYLRSVGPVLPYFRDASVVAPEDRGVGTPYTSTLQRLGAGAAAVATAAMQGKRMLDESARLDARRLEEQREIERQARNQHLRTSRETLRTIRDTIVEEHRDSCAAEATEYLEASSSIPRRLAAAFPSMMQPVLSSLAEVAAGSRPCDVRDKVEEIRKIVDLDDDDAFEAALVKACSNGSFLALSRDLELLCEETPFSMASTSFADDAGSDETQQGVYDMLQDWKLGLCVLVALWWMQGEGRAFYKKVKGPDSKVAKGIDANTAEIAAETKALEKKNEATKRANADKAAQEAKDAAEEAEANRKKAEEVTRLNAARAEQSRLNRNDSNMFREMARARVKEHIQPDLQEWSRVASGDVPSRPSGGIERSVPVTQRPVPVTQRPVPVTQRPVPAGSASPRSTPISHADMIERMKRVYKSSIGDGGEMFARDGSLVFEEITKAMTFLAFDAPTRPEDMLTDLTQRFGNQHIPDEAMNAATNALDIVALMRKHRTNVTDAYTAYCDNMIACEAVRITGNGSGPIAEIVKLPTVQLPNAIPPEPVPLMTSPPYGSSRQRAFIKAVQKARV